jgi:hypothetical protein
MSIGSRNRSRFVLVVLTLLFSLAPAYAVGQTIAAGVGRFKTSSANAKAKLQQILHGKTITFNADKIVYNPGILKPFSLSSNGGLLSQRITFILENSSSANSYKITPTINGIDPTEYKPDKTDCTIKAKATCFIEIVYVHSPSAAVSRTSAKLSISIAALGAVTPSITLPDIDLTGSNQTLVNQATVTSGIAPKIFFNPSSFFESVAGDSSLPQSVTIATEDPVGYTISTTTLSGADATDFSVTNCVGARLDRDSQQCIVTIGYSSKSAKRSAGQLVVTLVPDNQTPASGATPATPSNATITIALSGMTYSSCTGTPGYATYQAHHFFPLNHRGIDETTINCYYNTSNSLAFLTSASYQYNPAGSANTVSGDLASVQFTGGVQLTLAGTGTTSSCSSTSDTTTPTSSSCTSTSNGENSNTAAPSLEQDIQSLTQGGDFAIKALWPIYNVRAKRIQYSSIFNPRVGFTINGISATATAANATNVNAYITNENYFQIDGIPAQNGGDSPASLFVDYRWGLEYVGQSFATASMLTNNKFLLQQISAGLVIGGSVRISAERYVGPSQVYVDSTGTVASANNFSNWQLRVQFTPSSVTTH